MKGIELYACGRSTVQGSWHIDRSRIVNRLYYVNGGTARIQSGNGSYTLCAGKLYILPQCQDFRPLDAQSFDHTYFDYYGSRILRRDTVVALDATTASAHLLFAYVNALLNSATTPSHAAMEQLLCALLSVIEEHLPFESNTVVTQAVDLIQKSFATVSTHRLASALTLNESHFIRLFKRVMGITPTKYIRSCRVAHGKLLLQSGVDVATAAEQCGYASPSAFYKAIKSELSLPPSALK